MDDIDTRIARLEELAKAFHKALTQLLEASVLQTSINETQNAFNARVNERLARVPASIRAELLNAMGVHK